MAEHDLQQPAIERSEADGDEEDMPSDALSPSWTLARLFVLFIVLLLLAILTVYLLIPAIDTLLNPPPPPPSPPSVLI